ncbi:unnamed protein product [Danaus chrysippus]|uniref:(African queen) hypothetical protein n=1 Tax=Danaus chrysippus TaxID=151541 RepID=A0A8J2QWY6_9NEOP|nr:unnamed protein product [Danaus chrysippus]
MSPFTVWKLFSLFAFETSGDTWRDIHSIIGIRKREGVYFNKLFNYVTNLLLQLSPGRMLRTRQVVFHDTNLKLSRHFQRNIRSSGALMKRINFTDNVMAARLANDYIQLTNYTFIPKKIIFDETDFEETSMIVSGVVEFNGAWSVPFDDSNTVLEDGYKGNGKVYMMHQWAYVRYADIEQLGASVMELPYGEDKEYSMIIIRPEGDLTVTDVLENFAKIDFIEVIHRLYSEGLQEIEVKLPKFSLKSSLLLNGPLNSMDMSSIFSKDRAKIFKYGKSMYISELEHNTEIMVAEAGTFATASIPVEETVALQFSEKIRNLSLELFYYSEKENNSSVAMAPFTIFQLISLVAFKSGGETWKQMHTIFGIPKENGKQFNSLFMFINDFHVKLKPGRILKNIQVIFFDTDIGPYIKKFFVRNVLNAGVSMIRLNFDDNILAAESANNFIRMNVKSSAEDVVFDKTDFEETSMIVSGVVEFSGAWSVPFDDSNTVLEDGYKGNGKVYMMHQWAYVRYADIEQLGASVMELPYGEDKEYSMIIIRPEGDLTVTDVLENFAKIDFIEVIRRLYSEGLQEIEVTLPMFSITSTLILDGPLKSMGAKNGFLMNLADFSGISTEDIYISALEHRTTVMVAEGGTMVMAHTPGNFAHKTRETSNEMGQPFLFFIVHRKYMSIVFCGRYGQKDID